MNYANGFANEKAKESAQSEQQQVAANEQQQQQQQPHCALTKVDKRQVRGAGKRYEREKKEKKERLFCVRKNKKRKVCVCV